MAAAPGQQMSLGVPLGVGAALAVAAGAWVGLPGTVAALACVMAIGFTEPFPQATGPKGPGGRAPLPLDGREARKAEAWEAARALRFAPLTLAWLPGKGVQTSWLGGLWAAAAAAMLPAAAAGARVVAALAAFCAVSGFAAARRNGLDSPGVTVRAAVAALQANRRLAIRTGLAAAGGAVVSVAGAVLVARLLAGAPHGGPSPVWLWGVWCAAGGAGAGAVLALRPLLLADWRHLREVRDDWIERWRVLKAEPTRCRSTRTLDGVEATVFEAGGGKSSADLIGLAAKMAPLVGAGRTVAVLPTPDENSSGPVPGTSHPRRVEVVVWPDDEWPDVGDPGIDPELLELAVRFALAVGPAAAGLQPVVPTNIRALHADPEPVGEAGAQDAPPGDGAEPRAAWAADLSWPFGPGPSAVRIGGAGAAGLAGGRLGLALLDHRAAGGEGTLYFGDLGNAALDEATDRQIGVVADEDRWNSSWSQALKTGVNPPVLQYAQTATAKLANGTEVERWVFAARDGLDPSTYATGGTEGKLATAAGGAGFLTITGWTQGVGPRPGSRHPVAFTVYLSKGRVPGRPDDLAPCPGNANRWVLQGLVNHAFDAVRQPRPEIVSATCLTARASRGHIWEIQLHLYTATFGDVRTLAERIRQSWAAAWLRVTDSEDGCTIFVGADPRTVKLTDPARDGDRITRLDWGQAWVDAKVTGSANRVPVLTGSGRMEHNDQVQVLDFELPPGLDRETVAKGLPKLKTSTGNTYLELRPGVGGANTVRLLASADDPMPRAVGYDAASIGADGPIPFGTGVDGGPLGLDLKTSPHLLLLGGSGSGKSATAQSLLTGFLLRDMDLVVIDPTKGGADFRFAEPYCRAFATDLNEAAATIRAVYEEVVTRKNLNSARGVGSYRDLPDDIRPHHLVVVIDEFTSLMVRQQVDQKPFDDPELEAERMRVVEENSARAEIGSFTGRIGREARSAGVTLVLATQKLDSSILDKIGSRDLKDNMARLLMGKASFGSMMSGLMNPEAAADLGDVVPIGRGLYETPLMNGTPIQVWWAPSATLAGFVAAARQPVDPAQLLDVARFRRRSRADEGPAIVAVARDSFAPPPADEVIDLGELDLGLDFTALGDEPDPPEPVGEDPAPTRASPGPAAEPEETRMAADESGWEDLGSLWGGGPEPLPVTSHDAEAPEEWTGLDDLWEAPADHDPPVVFDLSSVDVADPRTIPLGPAPDGVTIRPSDDFR